MKGRKTGGRRRGTPNKSNAEVRALALRHGVIVLAELARLALEAESEAIRLAAGREILDRAYGKVATALAEQDEDPWTGIGDVRRMLQEKLARIDAARNPDDGRTS